MNKFLLSLFICLICSTCYAAPIVDEIANELPRAVAQPNVYKGYNFESTTKIPIELKIIKPIKSETQVYEGQYVDFKVVKDVIYNDKVIIRRGEIVPARISVIISPGMNGIPASIIFKDFESECLKKGQIVDTYEVFGQDRSLLVFPLKWALTILPPTGSLTNFIMGGHAKVKTKKPITVYYYPEWI